MNETVTVRGEQYPDVTLQRLRKAVTEWRAAPIGSTAESNAAREVVVFFDALDEQLRNRGSLPTEWQHRRPVPTPGQARMHPLTGAPLEQLDPAPRRRYAVVGKDDPCHHDSAGYYGDPARVPCPILRCDLCGTCWDAAGDVVPAPAVNQLDVPVEVLAHLNQSQGKVRRKP